MLKENEKKPNQIKKEKEEVKFFSYSLLFSFILIFFISSTITYKANTEVLEPKQENTITDPSLEKINKIEEIVFHQSYPKEKTENRLLKLENFILGSENPNLTIEERIKKISTALKIEDKKENSEVPEIKTVEQKENEISTEQKSKPETDENVGIFGTISKIEKQVYGSEFNQFPFEKRVELLEEKLLTSSERYKSKNKSLLERASYLVTKSMIEIPQEEPNNLNNQIQANNQTNKKRYIIDQSGFLINEDTGEFLRDNQGNPLSVNRPFLPQYNFNNQYGVNPYNNYGNQIPNNPYNPLLGNPVQNGLPPELLLQLKQYGLQDSDDQL